MKKIVLQAILLPVMIFGLCVLFFGCASKQAVEIPQSSRPSSIVYKNSLYGFEFTLPATWKGYSIVKGEWEGVTQGASGSEETVAKGPMLSIRNPKWTSQTPTQDIPIMIFTLSQWNDLKEGKFHIGAAPIGPTELGRNSKYVFALPARYNYSFPAGYKEVEEILSGKPLKPTENFRNQ